MLVSEQVYNELMKIKNGIEKFEKKKRSKVAAMKLFLPVQNEDGLYYSINEQFFYLVSSMMGRMIICNVEFKPGAEYPYEYMTAREFKKYQKTDVWLNSR